MIDLSLSLTKSWSYSYTIIWMFFVIPSCVCSDDKHHKHCSLHFTCGDQKNLSYPFWTPEREECGHPDFKVNCSGDHAEFSISSVQYKIVEMNHEDRIIRLARLDNSDNLCHENPESASINQLLPVSNDTLFLSFFYECPGPKVDFPYISHLECKEDISNEHSYIVRSELPSSEDRVRAISDNFRKSCERTIDVPVSRSALETAERNQTLEAIKKALGEDFGVSLDNYCSRCISTGGACGNYHGEFACYCTDRPHKHSCDPNPDHDRENKSESRKRKIGLAGGFLGAALLAGVVLCFVIRRRKKWADQYTSKGLPTPTPYSSNAMPITPTSKKTSNRNHSLVSPMSNLANASDYLGVQVFSYEELEEATENFSKELGDGGFGTVYYGVLKDGRAVAVKRLFERSLKRVEQFKNEIEILKSLKHPNLVILYGCTTRHCRELLLVYEYISNGTLADHLHGNQSKSHPICWPARLRIAIETASALSFLHAKGVIHRDVKTNNILLDSYYQVKVADFGISRLFPMDQTHISTAPQGTPGYVDPEYYLCYHLTEKSDVYSFGVVLCELISSEKAVDMTRHRHDINLSNMAITKIQNDAVHELADLSLGFWKDPAVKRTMISVAELAFRCLQQERDVRPSMDEIVEVLRGIQKEGIGDSPEVMDIDVKSGDGVRLLNYGGPPPVSMASDKGTTSSSKSSASSFSFEIVK